MIKLEHVVLASPEQMEFIIEGCRNPLNSWARSDSSKGCTERMVWGNLVKDTMLCKKCGAEYSCIGKPQYILGPNDHSLMQRLSNAGTEHRKYMRMMPVYVRITAPLYWWKEMETYKVGTVANSCSTMHKLTEKPFSKDDFSHEHLCKVKDELMTEFNEFVDLENKIHNSPYRALDDVIEELNQWRDFYLYYKKRSDADPKKVKKILWQMIQLLPSSYNQTRNVMMNYEVLANIYKSRRGHKLDEWCDFCKWIETLPYSEIIMSSSGLDLNSINALQGAARNSGKGYIYKRKTED